MSAAGTSPARWTRCARWLGLDHNPLRRRADRLEVTLRLLVLILIVAGVPLAALVSFGLAGLALITSGIAFVRGRHAAPQAEAFPPVIEHPVHV